MQLRYRLATRALGELADSLEPLLRQAEAFLENPRHGDFPRWKAALDQLPEVHRQSVLTQARVNLGRHSPDQSNLRQLLMQLHPWRKGPFNLGGVDIDCEWRSDWKWNRLVNHIDLQGQKVLDIGCGNGYFGWRMLAAGAELVVGIDPTLLFVMQYFACQHFADPNLANLVLPFGIEDLPADLSGFDRVFSMGVLYHRRSPIEHLTRLRELTRPGGSVVLETLVIEGDEQQVLVPQGRYARMRNVWFLPSVPALLNWLHRAGFTSAECVDVTITSLQEQHATEWMRFESLEAALMPDQPHLTVEGLPAPMRAVIIARTQSS